MAGSNHSDGGTATHKCGMMELLIFLAAIVSGTACSICSKTMMQLHGVGIGGDVEQFSKPIFQTFGMFVGMMFGLVMHWAVLFFKIPFPGYEHEPPPSATILPTKGLLLPPKYGAIPNEKDSLLNKSFGPQPTSTPTWMYYFLAIPSVFDLAATALCMMGLRYLDVSIYQLLRGSGIIFVALMKQHVLGDRLYHFQWLGVVWNVASVFLVGATAILNSQNDDAREAGEALLGVLLVMAGAFVQALQFVFEEKVMTMEDASAVRVVCLCCWQIVTNPCLLLVWVAMAATTITYWNGRLVGDRLVLDCRLSVGILSSGRRPWFVRGSVQHVGNVLGLADHSMGVLHLLLCNLCVQSLCRVGDISAE